MALPQLTPLKGYKNISGPVVTVIMDGVGLGKNDQADGVYVAHTPVLDGLMKNHMPCILKAHGRAVGLPTDKDMGNSEVGHNALGAGRVFAQGAKLVNEAIASGAVFKGAAWQEIEKRCGQGGSLHLLGLLSDGNVHSHINHLFAIIDYCISKKVQKLRVHTLLDGRDVGPKTALDYLRPLTEKLEQAGAAGLDYKIASGGGRMVTTMDRYEADWEIVKRGWDAHVLGRARMFPTALSAVETYYAEDPNMTDQYMPPFVIAEDGQPTGPVEDGDAVVLFNFRGDRAIEISRAFDEEQLDKFDRIHKPKIFYAGLMQYDGDAGIPANYLVEPPAIDKTLGEYLCGSGISSFAISETQKFGHVTYFWNGNKSGYIDKHLEKYVEIESDKVSFDLRPWMKAAEITDRVIAAVEEGRYSFIRLNYANGDMVGHTGVPEAVRIALETVDICLGRLLAAVEKAGGIAVVTADHGNADCMWTEKGGKITPMVSHTLNPVPFIVRDFSGANKFEPANIARPGLANVAATICRLLGYEPPEEYEPSLLKLSGQENK